MKSGDFFSRLYQGYAAEHEVAGRLFRRKYEVFRLPADFGFDLMVTDQFKRALNQGCDEKFPFALQVKSRWMLNSQVQDGPSGRRQFIINYTLKSSEVEILLETPNSGLALVFYLEQPTGATYDVRTFWLSPENIRAMLADGYLIQTGESYALSMRYREAPQWTVDDFISELSIGFSIDEILKKKLQKLLPEKFSRNWNADEYISFGRKPKGGEGELVYKHVGNLDYGFKKFPFHSDLRIAT